MCNTLIPRAMYEDCAVVFWCVCLVQRLSVSPLPWPDNDILWRFCAAVWPEFILPPLAGPDWIFWSERERGATSSRKYRTMEIVEDQSATRRTRSAGIFCGRLPAIRCVAGGDGSGGWQRTVSMSYHHNWYLGKYTPYHHLHLLHRHIPNILWQKLKTT